MASDDGKHIGEDFPVVEPDIGEADNPFLEGNQRSSLVVSTFGLTIFIFAVCAICNLIFRHCKEKTAAQRAYREERRQRALAIDSHSPPRRFLPNKSAKRLSPRASDGSPPASTHSSASYRRNIPLRPNAASSSPLPPNLSSSMAAFEENVLRRSHRDIHQSNEDSFREQEELSADELRRFQGSVFQSGERDRNQQQEELSADELRRIAKSIFQSDELERNQQEESSADELRRFQRSVFQSGERDRNQQEESSADELRRIARSIFQSDERDRNQQQADLPSSRRRSHENIELDNFLQDNELNTAYTRCFLNISGLGRVTDDSHQQGELRDTSLQELLGYHSRFGSAIESEDPLQQNESSAASSLLTRRHHQNIDSNTPLQHNESSAASSLRTRRHHQNIDSNTPLQYNESSTSSQGSLNTQRVSLGALASRFYQRNQSGTTPFGGLSNIRRGSSLNTGSSNSLQQHASSSASFSEIPVHERGFDGLLPIAENITTRSLDESLNRTESDTEDSEVKRHSSP